MVRRNMGPFYPSDISAKCLKSTPQTVGTASILFSDILGMSDENSTELADCRNSLIQKFQMSEENSKELEVGATASSRNCKCLRRTPKNSKSETTASSRNSRESSYHPSVQCKSECVSTNNASHESDVKTGVPKTTLGGPPAKPEARVGYLERVSQPNKYHVSSRSPPPDVTESHQVVDTIPQ